MVKQARFEMSIANVKSARDVDISNAWPQFERMARKLVRMTPKIGQADEMNYYEETINMGTQKPQFDPTRKFVRVSEVRPDGFIAFDFAIGEPELYVEMILTQPAFEEFCSANNVIRLDAAQPETEESGLGWRLDQATYHKPR